jgi:putative ATPase
MLSAGENPKYLLRRLLRTSYEDIGLADTNAQAVCLNAFECYERLGSPEGDIALAQAVIYLALSPKSNSVYLAHRNSLMAAKKKSSLQPPDYLAFKYSKRLERNVEKYIYDHDTEHGFSGQNYFPTTMKPENYYQPVGRGDELRLRKRLKDFIKLRKST